MNGRPRGVEVTPANKPRTAAPIQTAAQRYTRWNSRHQLILYMDVAGERVVDIANKLNMAPGSISAVKGSPLYQTQKAQLLEQLAGTTFENLKDLIATPNVAIKNVEFLVNVRDSMDEETKDRLAAARGISREVDRVFPRTIKKEESREIRISIDAGKLARIASTLSEIGANTVSPGEVIDMMPYNDETSPPISAKSIDEFRDECLAAESDELLDES